MTSLLVLGPRHGLQRPEPFANRRVQTSRPVRHLHRESTSRRCRTSSSAGDRCGDRPGAAPDRSPVAPTPVTWPTVSSSRTSAWTTRRRACGPACSARRSRTAGDPAYAKQLIAESGEPMPTITYSYSQNPTRTRAPPPIKASLGKAGIKVKLNPIEARPTTRRLRQVPRHRADERRLGPGLAERVDGHPAAVHPEGWLGPLPRQRQGLQRQGRRSTTETDRDEQAELWKDLNKEAMQQVWVVPTLFENDQRLAGSKVHSASGKDGQMLHRGCRRFLALRRHVRHAVVGRTQPARDRASRGAVLPLPGSREPDRSFYRRTQAGESPGALSRQTAGSRNLWAPTSSVA